MNPTDDPPNVFSAASFSQALLDSMMALDNISSPPSYAEAVLSIQRASSPDASAPTLLPDPNPARCPILTQLLVCNQIFQYSCFCLSLVSNFSALCCN